MAKRSVPEVNAGSMADIAFLLLIFFLVTTTIEKDKGILRSLPPIEEEQVDPPEIKDKNLHTIVINFNDDLLVEDEPMKIEDLKQATIDFLDNGGSTNAEGESCDYCKGERDASSSDHPDKAIVTLKYDRRSSHGKYIEVQNSLLSAYNFLRDREAQRLFNRSYQSMLEEKEKNQFNKDEKLNEDIQTIKDMYPLKLSESQPDKVN